MKRKKRRNVATPQVERDLLGGIRQFLYPSEFRIAAPISLGNLDGVFAVEAIAAAQQTAPEPSPQAPGADRMIAELASCLWYLKTKHFRREWDAEDGSDDDPRVRRALGRLNKGIDALKREGVEVQDPVNKRYQPGSEGTMRPIQFDPTPGLTYQKVTETVAPIIYHQGRIIQRGEVFVAVPQEPLSDPKVESGHEVERAGDHAATDPQQLQARAVGESKSQSTTGNAAPAILAPADPKPLARPAEVPTAADATQGAAGGPTQVLGEQQVP